MTTAPTPPAIDPARQAARTRLAWNRTALACLGNALLVAFRLPDSRVPVVTWSVLALAGVLGVVVLVLARGREHELAHTDHPTAAPVRLTLLGTLVALLALLVTVDLVTAA